MQKTSKIIFHKKKVWILVSSFNSMQNIFKLSWILSVPKKISCSVRNAVHADDNVCEIISQHFCRKIDPNMSLEEEPCHKPIANLSKVKGALVYWLFDREHVLHRAITCWLYMKKMLIESIRSEIFLKMTK